MQQISKSPLFPLGQIVATPGALAALEKAKSISRRSQPRYGVNFHKEGQTREECSKANGLAVAQVKTTDQVGERAVRPARPAFSAQLSYAGLLHDR
jgi:hypothetical protein